jgi:hypothetical protein
MRFVKQLTGREGFQPIIEHPDPPLILFAMLCCFLLIISVYTVEPIGLCLNMCRIVGLAQLKHIHISVNGSIEFNIHGQEL